MIRQTVKQPAEHSILILKNNCVLISMGIMYIYMYAIISHYFVKVHLPLSLSANYELYDCNSHVHNIMYMYMYVTLALTLTIHVHVHVLH